MKIREMDIYFTVPVDRTALKSCRKKAGYATAKQFQEELTRRGISITYRNVENVKVDTQGNPKRVRADVAELLAAVMGLQMSVVFPQYSPAKVAAERDVKERYYAPFTTTEECNAAIVAAMENVRKAALNNCKLLKNQNGCCYLGQDDIISLAYMSLVAHAKRAMRKGIKKDVCFEASACVAVKNDFLRINKDNRQVRRKAEMYSLDAPIEKRDGQDWHEYRGEPHNIMPGTNGIEDQLELREECLQAIRTVPRDRWADPQEADALINVCFPSGVTAYA